MPSEEELLAEGAANSRRAWAWRVLLGVVAAGAALRIFVFGNQSFSSPQRKKSLIVLGGHGSSVVSFIGVPWGDGDDDAQKTAALSEEEPAGGGYEIGGYTYVGDWVREELVPLVQEGMIAAVPAAFPFFEERWTRKDEIASSFKALKGLPPGALAGPGLGPTFAVCRPSDTLGRCEWRLQEFLRQAQAVREDVRQVFVELEKQENHAIALSAKLGTKTPERGVPNVTGDTPCGQVDGMRLR